MIVYNALNSHVHKVGPKGVESGRVVAVILWGMYPLLSTVKNIIFWKQNQCVNTRVREQRIYIGMRTTGFITAYKPLVLHSN